jgi:endonuclease/exonuclease/phosphatase family metal-dependent hydrolase
MRKTFVVLFLIFTSMAPARAESEPLTVISRNLYLGADVGVALELIPDFSAAAQFMWDQVAATDFTRRAPALAKEVIDSDADVIGLQEATNWYCKKNMWSKKVVVFNFTELFLKATKDAGHEYVLANKAGTTALNIGYSIPAIPYLTMVNDPEVFQPLFGSDRAACGFEIGDAIAVKKEFSGKVLNVGNSEYEVSYSIIPKVMTIYRGYTWVDLSFNNSKVRIVSTHLESLWDADKVPNAALQADQLISDLAKTKMPLIVMGDFNSDPRDPRPNAKSNPGGQPEASKSCPAQVAQPTILTADESCNAYWLMRKAGFEDAGPDSLNPTNYTWGMDALLHGADPERLAAAKDMGNTLGFTDRLDYIFLKNGAETGSVRVIGASPYIAGSWASDHAGLVAEVHLPESGLISPPLDAHAPFPISFWNWVGLFLIAISTAIILRRRKKS